MASMIARHRVLLHRALLVAGLAAAAWAGAALTDLPAAHADDQPTTIVEVVTDVVTPPLPEPEPSAEPEPEPTIPPADPAPEPDPPADTDPAAPVDAIVDDVVDEVVAPILEPVAEPVDAIVDEVAPIVDPVVAPIVEPIDTPSAPPPPADPPVTLPAADPSPLPDGDAAAPTSPATPPVAPAPVPVVPLPVDVGPHLATPVVSNGDLEVAPAHITLGHQARAALAGLLCHHQAADRPVPTSRHMIYTPASDSGGLRHSPCPPGPAAPCAAWTPAPATKPPGTDVLTQLLATVPTDAADEFGQHGAWTAGAHLPQGCPALIDPRPA